MVGKRGVVANSPRLCQHQLYPQTWKDGLYPHKVWERRLYDQVTICTIVSNYSKARHKSTKRHNSHLQGKGKFAWISLLQWRADRQVFCWIWGTSWGVLRITPSLPGNRAFRQWHLALSGLQHRSSLTLKLGAILGELFIGRDLCSEAKHVAFALPGTSGGMPSPRHSRGSHSHWVPPLLWNHLMQEVSPYHYVKGLLYLGFLPPFHILFVSLAFSLSDTLYSC